jgi:hypothetical protein|tara:strand:- start:8402 stop:8605 length:204 start_codon:yes stop_codon:yes gene_type:complete
MTLFLILFIIGAAFIALGYGNQLKAGSETKKPDTTDTTDKSPKTKSSTIIKYVPMEYYEDMVLTHKE